MPSTYTPQGLEKVNPGEQVDTWGPTLNRNFDIISQSIGGILVVTLPASGTYTISATQGQVGDGRNAVIVLRGVLTGVVTVLLPAISRVLDVLNQATGSNNSVTLAVSGSSGTTVQIPAGNWRVFCDSVNIFRLNDTLFSGSTIPQATPPDTVGGSYLNFFGPGTAHYRLNSFTDGRFYIQNITTQRNSIVINPEDGTVSFPSSGIKSNPGSGESLNPGWTINNTGYLRIGTRNAPTGFGFVSCLNNGTVIGGLTSNSGGGLSLYSVSDHRLKIDHGDAVPMALYAPTIPVHDAAWRAAPDRFYPMFFAHEVAEHRPWAVTGEKDAVDDKGRVVPQAVDASMLIPELWARVDALVAEVEELEKRLREIEVGE